jgi:3-keto-5-aminohexanoate cleavage enzyme
MVEPQGPSPDKVIVTCALTGVLANRDQCPWVPYTPAEIAEEARRAYEAGAAVVHIHARTDEGGPTYEPAIYAAIAAETRKRCPVILNFSTGGAGPMEGRVAHIAQVKPAIAALNMGSMNYAKYSPRRKEFVFDFVFENPFRDISYLLAVMKEASVKPELECFDVGHTNSIWPLIDKGLLKRPLQFSFIMGVLGGIRASAENLALQAREAPPDSTWEVIGISHEQWRMVGAALSLGGNVRVGLEDNFYLDSAGKEMAKSNGELVGKAVRMARDMGREPATVDEARRLLTLDAAW